MIAKVSFSRYEDYVISPSGAFPGLESSAHDEEDSA